MATRGALQYDGTDLNYIWSFVIQPYVKSTQVFKCPSNSANGLLNDSHAVAGAPNTIPISYRVVAGNANTSGETNVAAKSFGGKQIFASISEPARTCSLAELNSSAQTIMVFETGSIDDGGAQDSALYQIAGTPPTGSDSLQLQNHLGTSNYLFADGHVKSLKPLATGFPLNLWNIKNTTNATDTATGPASTNLLNQLGVLEKGMS